MTGCGVQRKSWSSHKGECRVVEIFETTDRGKGMRARRLIVPGELVIKETPLGKGSSGDVTEGFKKE